jgi:plastocyanin
MVTWTPRNILLVSIVIAALAGSITGLATSMLLRTSPAPQTRDLYLFAIDGSFNSTATKGLTSDYYYSATNIVVNRGDTLIIHFYNPTDQDHTFTMSSPYANDANVPASTNNVIHNATITFTANNPGTYSYHCKFHTPQMTGAIVVQGS